MLRKLNVLLFKPAFIGKYITDSFLNVLAFFFVFITLISFSAFLNVNFNSGMGRVMEQTLVTQVANNLLEDDELRFVDGKLIGNTSFSFNLSTNIVFKILPEQADSSLTKTVFNFMEDRLVIFVYGATTGLLTATHFYDNQLVPRNFNFQEVQSNFIHRNALLVFMNNAFDRFQILHAPITFISIYIATTFTFVLYVAMVAITTSRFAMFVRGKLRIKLLAYASTWICLAMLFQQLFRIPELSILGLIISYYFAKKALRSIIKIETTYVEKK